MKRKTPYTLLRSIKNTGPVCCDHGAVCNWPGRDPELVYVRDIYENGNARANTMFKLTYQAYILFGHDHGLCDLPSALPCQTKSRKDPGGSRGVLFAVDFWIFGNSVHSWFGDVTDPSAYQGLNATAFLETDFPEDAEGIRWLRSNIEGFPGSPGSKRGQLYRVRKGIRYDRASYSPGLGMYMNGCGEMNVADLNGRSADVETIYTSNDEEQVKALLEKYQVSYIFPGKQGTGEIWGKPESDTF